MVDSLPHPVAGLDRGFLAEVLTEDAEVNLIPLSVKADSQPARMARGWLEESRARLNDKHTSGSCCWLRPETMDKGAEASGVPLPSILAKDAPRVFSGELSRAAWTRVCCLRVENAPNRKVAYTQHFGLVCGFFMLLLDENDAPALLQALDESTLRGYWDPDPSALSRDTLVFDSMLSAHDSELALHIRKVGVPSFAFTQRWLGALCVTTLPFRNAFDLIDLVITEDHGVLALFAFGLALCTELRAKMLASTDTATVLALLQLDFNRHPGDSLEGIACNIIQRTRELLVSLSGDHDDAVERPLLTPAWISERRAEARAQLQTPSADVGLDHSCSECQICLETMPDLYCKECRLCLCTECAERYCPETAWMHCWVDFDFDSKEHTSRATVRLGSSQAVEDQRAECIPTTCKGTQG